MGILLVKRDVTIVLFFRKCTLVVEIFIVAKIAIRIIENNETFDRCSWCGHIDRI